MRLLTQRLILRDFEREDVDSLVRNINNLNVSRYLSKVPYPYTQKLGKEYLERVIKRRKQKPHADYSFAIQIKGSQGVIGCVGLHDINYTDKRLTLGYWLAEEHWRKGYMSEAVNRLIEFSFKRLGMKRIDVDAFVENDASNGLVRSLGFRQEGMRRRYIRAKSTGKWHDTNIYGRLREEWESG